MAIWFRLAVRLTGNFRRIRLRIIVRKMNRFARACWRYQIRMFVDERIDGGPRLVPPKDWPAVRTPQPSPGGDDNWDDVWGPNLTGMPCIGNGASSNTQLHPTPAAHPSHTSRWEGCNLYLDLSPSFLAICKECQQYEHCAPGEPFWQQPAPQKTAGTEQQERPVRYVRKKRSGRIGHPDHCDRIRYFPKPGKRERATGKSPS